MSADKFNAHLVVILEDDANRQIVNGFRNHLEVGARKIQVEPVAGGWKKVLDTFKSDHITAMRKFPKRHILLLFDLDGNPSRIEAAKDVVPDELRDRVYVLGVYSEPEDLSSSICQTEETIGEKLAEACLNGDSGLWGDPLLKHNYSELERMQSSICGHLRA